MSKDNILTAVSWVFVLLTVCGIIATGDMSLWLRVVVVITILLLIIDRAISLRSIGKIIKAERVKLDDLAAIITMLKTVNTTVDEK